MIKYLAALLAAFFIYNFILLDKYPIVTPDETWFANYAYSLTKKEALGSAPFQNRLPTIDEDAIAAYGPVYTWVLSLPLRFLPYGLAATRLTSVFLGTLTIFAFFLLSKSLFKSSALALLSAFLLSIDYSFLLRSRFVRPEILVILFTCLAFLFYKKTWENPKTKYYLTTGLFISLSLFTHYLLGIIAPMTIFLHFIISRGASKPKNFLYLSLPTIIFSIFWFLYLTTQNPNIKDIWQTVISSRTAPNFQLLISFPNWDLFKLVIFIIYLLSFFALLNSAVKLKNNIKTFCLLSFLSAFIIFSYGNSIVYEGILSFPALLCLAAKKGKFFLPVSLAVLTFANIYGQVLILYKTAGFSYSSFGKTISEQLEPGAKVLLKQTNPNPYFYLAEKRPDLKLDYTQVLNRESYTSSLSQADYIITHGYDLKFFEDYKKSRTPLAFPFDLTLTEFLQKNEGKTQVIANLKTIFIYNTVVIKIQK